jgi:membrane-bound acyltransferase YfiQ involved in biofilm formation
MSSVGGRVLHRMSGYMLHFVPASSPGLYVYQNFLLVFMYVYIVDFAKSKVDDLAMILMIVVGLDAAKAEMNIKTCPCKETCSRFQTK